MGRRPTSISKIVMRNDLFDRLLHMYWDKPKGLTSYILLRVTPAMILLVYFVVWDLNSSLVRKTQSIWRPNSVFPGQNPSGRILRTGPRQLFVHATDLPRQGAAWAARGVRAPSARRRLHWVDPTSDTEWIDTHICVKPFGSIWRPQPTGGEIHPGRVQSQGVLGPFGELQTLRLEVRAWESGRSPALGATGQRNPGDPE